MAEKPIKGDKGKKDVRDDESDEEATDEYEYPEDTEPLLGDKDRNKPEEEKLTAEESKPSTTKEGEMEAEPPTSGESEDKLPSESARIPYTSVDGRPITFYEVETAHKRFYEVRPFEEGYESASDSDDPANIPRSASAQTFLPTDDDTKNEEDNRPSRHVTGIVAMISKGKSTVIETVPMAQVAQRGVKGVGIGDLVVSQGLMAAAVSTPNVPGARPAGEVAGSIDAAGGTIPKNITGESIDDKAKPCKEASPAKKAKAETTSPAKKAKAETSSPAKKGKTSSPAKKSKAETSSPAKKAKKESTPRKHVSRFLERLSPRYRKLESSSSDSSLSSSQIPFSELRLQGADSPSEMSEQSSSKDDEKALSSSEEEKSRQSSSKKRDEDDDSAI